MTRTTKHTVPWFSAFPAAGNGADSLTARTRQRLPGWVLIVWAVLLLSVGSPAPAGSASGNLPVHRVLANGLTILLQENHAAPVVSVQVWVKTGSAPERRQEYGMAHMLEHMLFKGTRTRGVGVVAKEVEAAGGVINAYTSWDTTVYFVNVGSSFIDTGIDILADMMFQATLDPDELAREKEVVLEEIRMGKDVPEDRFSDTFFEKTYRVHPYGRPVIGFEESVQRFTREDLLGFYQKWYVPENMVWVIAGDFDARGLLGELETKLSPIPARKAAVQIHSVEPPQEGVISFVLKQDVAEAHLKIGFHIPGISHPDVPALDLLAQILGEGRSSRLYQAFRLKKRLVNSVSAYSLTPRDPGMFGVGASLETQDLAGALSGILEEIFRTAFEPVTEEELRTAKVQIESDFIYAKQTVQGQATEIGNFESVVGDVGFGDRYLGRLRSVRPRDLLRVAETYLVPDKVTVGVLLPDGKAPPLSEEDLRRQVSDSFRETISRFGKQGAGDEDGEDSVSRTRLPNGALLLIKENPAVPLVSCQALFLGGLLSETPEKNGIGDFTARMLSKGTSSRSAENIAKEIESLAGSVSGFSGRSGFGLSLDVVSWNLSQAMDLFSDILLHPEFPQEFVEKTRQDILAAIKNQEDDLATLAFRQFWKNLYPCHPYGMDRLGTPESVARLTREDLAAYYRSTAVGPNLVLAVVGDVNRQEVQRLAEQSVGQLPGSPYDLPRAPCEQPPVREATRLAADDKLQTHLLIGARGVRYADADRYSLGVLGAILAGQGGRLFVELRDRQSLAYSVTTFSQEAYDPGAFMVYIATTPENRVRAREGILRELSKMREEEVPGEELERAKNYLVGTYDLSLQTNSAQASVLASNERLGTGFHEYWRYPKRIREVTAQDVRAAARRYLCPDCLIEAAVSPAASSKTPAQPGAGPVDTGPPSSGK